MGRKKLEPNEKKQLVRLFAKKSVIDLLSEEKIKTECNQLINRLQSESLTKCADEALKSKL